VGGGGARGAAQEEQGGEVLGAEGAKVGTTQNVQRIERDMPCNACMAGQEYLTRCQRQQQQQQAPTWY